MTMFSTKKSSTHTGQVIDCAKDPLDLRPAVDGIMAAIARVRANLAEDQPIFVPIGECHSMPTHKLLQAALLTALIDEYGLENIAFGVEKEHNLLEKIIIKGLDIVIPDHFRGKISASDTNGQHILKAHRAACTPSYAPVALQTLYHHCFINHIVTHFNDAARNDKSDLLDLSDPLMAEIARKCYGSKISRSIIPYNLQGLHLRNMFMVEKACTQQKSSGAKIYVQHCGAGHLFGYKEIVEGRIVHHKYEHSLVAPFRAAGAAVPVFPEYSTFLTQDIPRKARNILSDSVIIQGLDESGYSYAKSPHGAEAEFLARIMKHSGMTDIEIIDTLNPTNATELEALQYQVCTQIPLWIAEAQAVL